MFLEYLFCFTSLDDVSPYVCSYYYISVSFFFSFTICSLNILLIKILVIPFWFLGLTCFLIGSIHDLCIFFTSMLFLTKSDGRYIL